MLQDISLQSLLIYSVWLTGPKFLWRSRANLKSKDYFPNLPENLPEQVTESVVCKTNVKTELFIELLNKTSDRSYTVSVAQKVIGVAFKWLDRAREKMGLNLAPRSNLCYKEFAVTFLISEAQNSCFADILTLVSKGESLPTKHKLAKF